MSRFSNNLMIVATVALMAVGGCATTGGSLTSSATRLERSAYALQEEANDGDVRGDFRRDARQLAEQAREFRRVVEDRDSSKEDVHDAFEDVSRRYHAMRDEVDRDSDRETHAEFRDVTEAYLDVEREMRSRDSRRDRLARD
jgi:membrane-bound lytic murein transglycosylase B